jgi:hypothetical protein
MWNMVKLNGGEINLNLVLEKTTAKRRKEAGDGGRRQMANQLSDGIIASYHPRL